MITVYSTNNDLIQIVRNENGGFGKGGQYWTNEFAGKIFLTSSLWLLYVLVNELFACCMKIGNRVNLR